MGKGKAIAGFIILGIVGSAYAEPLTGVDYECREAKIDLKQAMENPVPIRLHGKDRVSWYDANRTVSNRINGRVLFINGAGSAQNGKLRLAARGISFPDEVSTIEVNIEYLLANTPKTKSFYSTSSSMMLKKGEVGVIDLSDAGEHDIHLQCSFSPVRQK